MKKILFHLIVLLVVLVSNTNAIMVESSLREFANYVAKENRVKILLTDEVRNNDFYLFGYDDEETVSIDMFKEMIYLNGYLLKNNGDFYYVELLDESNYKNKDERIRYIKFDNNIYDDVSQLMANSDINATFFLSENSVSFYSDKRTYDDIFNLIKNIDKTPKQVQFKLTITETNLNDVKRLGTDLNSLFRVNESSDFSYYINLITMPYTATNNILSNRRNGYYGVLNFLQDNGITKIKSSPFLTAKNKTMVFFSSVENIPYKVSDNTYSQASTTTSTTYDYKDVGLKIEILPTILNNRVEFDLNLTIEDILDRSDMTPTTSKKTLISSYSLKKGELLVLSGINKETSYSQRIGIPILKDIWLLKYLFSMETDRTVNTVLTLTIELL